MSLRDDQWEKLEPLLIGRNGDPGASGRDNRRFIEAVLWHISSQRSWSHLPAEFGKWSTTYMRFRRWNECGAWQLLKDDLHDAPELSALVEKIVIYGDEQMQRTKRRASRKSNRKAHMEIVKPGEGGNNLIAPTLEDVDLSWLRLSYRS